MNNFYAIILAGGSGVRLWPLSRQQFPKQLLKLGGDDSLLMAAARRLLKKIPASQIITVTGADQKLKVAEQLKEVDEVLMANVFEEPLGRNTLPAIAWAVAHIGKSCPNAIISVFPSDHLVKDQKAFLEALSEAQAGAAQGRIVLFGIESEKPATGYGYVKAGKALDGSTGRVCEVLGFTEKPDEETARQYLAEGGYYWNSGMFTFEASVFLKELERLEPKIFELVQTLVQQNQKQAAAGVYEQMPSQSIDYGIIEKTAKAAVIGVNMGWTDLGSWEAVYQNDDFVGDDNTVHGDVVTLDSAGNLLWSEHGLIAALGVDDLVVVQTVDATLVCPRSRCDELKPLVNLVGKSYPTVVKQHMTDVRPWGEFTILTESLGYKVKRIVVKPGYRLSLQSHEHRAEHWTVVSGVALVSVGDQVQTLKAGEHIFIGQGARHRVTNEGKEPLVFIEVQTGINLSENDICRFEDDFGRV